MLFTPSPLSQTVTPSRTPSPSSVTYFMDGPTTSVLTVVFLFNIAGVYFGCVTIMCTLSVIMTVLVLNFHHRTPDMYVMPLWVSILTNGIACQPILIRAVSQILLLHCLKAND